MRKKNSRMSNYYTTKNENDDSNENTKGQDEINDKIEANENTYAQAVEIENFQP